MVIDLLKIIIEMTHFAEFNNYLGKSMSSEIYLIGCAQKKKYNSLYPLF